MSQVEAIYQNGVFKPLDRVELTENQRVRLDVQPIDEQDVLAWLERTQRHRDAILKRRGGVPLPDSTPDIAEDRLRDV